MTNWAPVEAELRERYRRPESANQMWRWSAGFREWIDRRGTDVRVADDGDFLAFLDVEDWGPGTRNRDQRVTAMRALVMAARAVAPSRSRNIESAAAWLDRIPARSPLGKAVARVLARAKTEGDRRRFRTALGTFGRWCEEVHGVRLEDVWPGDVDAFRRDYLESGRSSPGEYVRVARMLLAEIAASR